MSNRKRKCLHCKEYSPLDTCTLTNVGSFCSIEHAVLYGKEKATKDRAKAIRKAEIRADSKRKDAKAANRLRKKAVMRRSEWYARLQSLVNQYVVHVRDKDKGCCTCGKTNPDIKYDAGHLYTRAARSDIRFELTNIHKQCSVNCNQHGSGMRKEYEDFIVNEYGESHLCWLKERKDDLKVQFPSWQDIEKEIILYRALLRDHGITPNV